MPIDELQDIRYAMKETIYQVTLDKIEDECNHLTDLKKILKKALEIVAEAVHAEACSVWLYHKEEDVLTPYVTYGGKKLVGVKVDAKKSIAGKVATSKKSILVDNVKNNKNWSSATDKKSGYETKTMICVPAVYENISYGSVQFINRIDDESYDEKDLGFIQAIVGYVFSRVANNKEFIAYLISNENAYAEARREQIINNFLTLLEINDKKTVEKTMDDMQIVKHMSGFDRLRFTSSIATLQKIARKENEK